MLWLKWPGSFPKLLQESRKIPLLSWTGFWNRLSNYVMTWAWDCSNTAWPSTMSHLWWAYIVVQTMLVKKIQKFIVNSFCFLTFWINSFWQQCKNWRSFCSYWQKEEKRWWSNSVVTCKQLRWKCESSSLQTWLYERRAGNAFRIALCQAERLQPAFSAINSSLIFKIGKHLFEIQCFL